MLNDISLFTIHLYFDVLNFKMASIEIYANKQSLVGRNDNLKTKISILIFSQILEMILTTQ